MTRVGHTGDIESMPFIEAMRQFQFRIGRENMCFLHLTLVRERERERERET